MKSGEQIVREGYMFEATPLERQILDDLEAKTGLSFRRLGGISTRDKRIAEATLPILAEWVSRVEDENHRNGIYARFQGPHAYPFIDKIIQWWQTERYGLALACLTQILAEIAKPQDAQRLWKLCRELPPRPFHYLLLAKLATFPDVAMEVRQELVKALSDPTLTVGDIEDISSVNDPRIRKWFEGQVDSPNRDLRILARRVVKRGQKIPDTVQLSPVPPDLSTELFSAEVDLWKLKPLLKRVARELRLKIPASFQNATFLSSVELNQWVKAPIATTKGDPAMLWYWLEDIDTVAVVITEKSGTANHA